MTKVRKILITFLFAIFLIIIGNSVKATTISITPTNPKVGDTVTISVSVPNVHTSTVTANVSGVVSGKIKVVGGDLSGAPTNYSNSAQYYCSSEGKIEVSISSDSTAVLNGEYVNVAASASVVVEPNQTDVDPGESDNSNSDNSNNSNTGNSNSTTENDNSNIQNDNSSNTNNESKENKKSSNANLKNLGIRPNDFSGFKSGTTTYNVTVPSDVTSVELYAVKDDDKATLTGTGTKKLQEGTNKLSVTVTAEDGTQKTYTVNVTREAKEEVDEQEDEEIDEEIEEEKNTIEEDIESTSIEDKEVTDGLIELRIIGAELSPEFETGIYEYTVKYIGEATKLQIQTEASDESYNIEIIGNKDLKEGENLITILVSDEEGKNVATYQLTVNKSLVDVEALAREEAEKQEQKKKNVILGGAIAVLLIIILIIIIIVRSKRNRRWGNDYSIPGLEEAKNYKDYLNGYNSEDNSYGANIQFQDYEEEVSEETEVPKHSKGKRFK